MSSAWSSASWQLNSSVVISLATLFEFGQAQLNQQPGLAHAVSGFYVLCEIVAVHTRLWFAFRAHCIGASEQMSDVFSTQPPQIGRLASIQSKARSQEPKIL